MRWLTLAGLLLIANPASTHEVKFDVHRAGIVKEVRKDALLVEQPSQVRLTVGVNSTTIIQRNGRDAEIGDVKIGDRVAIDVIPNPDGTLYAVMVRARSASRRKVPATTGPHGAPSRRP